MLLKILDRDRVKILMENDDVDYYDLPYEKLNYEDPASKAFIYDLIQKTYEQTGVDFLDCRLMIEVIPGVSRTYYVLLTRLNGNGSKKVEFDKIEQAELEMYLFRFERGSDVFKFFKNMKRYCPEKSDLFLYGRMYYVALSFSGNMVNDGGFVAFLEQLSEYGERCQFHPINEAILRERGIKLLGPDVHGYF